MNQELVMMFNGIEGNQIPSTETSQEVSADGMMAAFYDEIQQNMQQTISGVNQSVEVVQEDVAYKSLDCSVLNPGSIPVSIETAATSVSEFISEGNTCSATVADQGNLKVKTIEIPDSWRIAILESNGVSSHTAEPLVEGENQGYQLWECPICTALFREKEICEQHVIRSHDFTCGLCSEPFQEKEALENHVIRHISEIPGHALQKISFGDSEHAGTEDAKSSRAAELANDANATSRKVFSCTDCNLTFSSVQDLANHKECHMDDDDEEGEGKTSEESYYPSKTVESGSKVSGGKFTCDVCGQKCFTKNSLLLHMTKRHSALVSKNYVCDECGESFKWKLSLQNHQIVEHGRRKQKF